MVALKMLCLMQRRKAGKGRQAQAIDESHEAEEPETADLLEPQYAFSAFPPAEPAAQDVPAPLTDASIAGHAERCREGKHQAMKVRGYLCMLFYLICGPIWSLSVEHLQRDADVR